MNKFFIPFSTSVICILLLGCSDKKQEIGQAPADVIDSCVTGTVQAYRKHAGEDALVRHDMLEEWTNQCKSKDQSSRNEMTDEAKERTARLNKEREENLALAAKYSDEDRDKEARQKGYVSHNQMIKSQVEISAPVVQEGSGKISNFEYSKNGVFALNPSIPPVRQSGRNRYWKCDGLISPEFREAVFKEAMLLAEVNKIPLPSSDLCDYSIEKIDELTIYSVRHFNSLTERSVCFSGGACRNLHMMKIGAKDGEFFRSYTLIGPDAAKTYRACLKWNGTHKSLTRNCLELESE